jgi:hypothetical protein
MSDEKIKLTREEIYQKVWSKPATLLAKDLGISDVAEPFFCDAQIATVIMRFYRKGTLYFSKHLSKGLPSL